VKTKLSFVLSTNYLRRCHCRWRTLVVQTTEQWSCCQVLCCCDWFSWISHWPT